MNLKAPIESLKNNLVEIARNLSPNSNVLNRDNYFKAPVGLGNIIHRNCEKVVKMASNSPLQANLD